MSWMVLPQRLPWGCYHDASRATVISKFHWRRIHFQSHSCGFWQASGEQFPSSFTCLHWPQKTYFQLIYMGLSIGPPHEMATDVPQSKQENNYTCDKSNSLCYNLILEATFYYFCHILFIRSKYISSLHPQGKTSTQECKYQKAGSTGGHLRGYLPTWDIPKPTPMEEI